MAPLKMIALNSLCFSPRVQTSGHLIDSLLEKTIKCFLSASGDEEELELEDKLHKLTMSHEDENHAKKTPFDREEMEMLARANCFLARCLWLDELDEAARKTIAKRANSFLALYLKKGGKSLFKTVVSGSQNFAHFLLLVHEKTLDLSGFPSGSHGVLQARGPTRKSTALYQRHHPYDELSENRGRSRVQLHLAGGESSSEDHPIGLPSVLQDVEQTVPTNITQEEECKDVSAGGLEAGGDSPAPSEEELNQAVEYFLECCLSEQQRERLRAIFHDVRHFPDLKLSNLSPEFSFEALLSHDDEDQTQDHPVMSPGITSPMALLGTDSPAPVPAVPASSSSQVCAYSSVEKLSNLDLGTSPNPAVLLTKDLLCSYRTATEEFLARMNPREREDRLRKLSQHRDEEILFRDEDGDTRLMIACANSSITLEEIFALTERLKSHPEQFTLRNHYGKSALLLAAVEKRPLVAGYIAETMISLGLPVNQTDAQGNNIIHTISSLGDEFAEVLGYLIRVKTSDGKSAFDLSAFNYKGKTALHEAITSHSAPTQSSTESCASYKIVELLLTHGADAAFRDATSGRTSIHYAIEKQDLRLLETILVLSPKSANALSYNDNTPLHIAGTLLNVTEEMQLRMVKLLLKHGADKTRRNKAKKLPIEVVPRDRVKVKEVLMARPRQSRPS